MMRRLFRWTREERGAVSPMMVLLLVPLIGVMALAGEGGFWFMAHRGLQNAADSAALAAATSDDTTADSGMERWEREARSVALEYGYATGVDAATVTPEKNVTCPDDNTKTDCYRVTISYPVPLYLTGIVGYQGDVVMGDGRRGRTITAIAIAKPPGDPAQYCMLGLSESGDAIRINGGPDVDLAGCDLKSNSNLNCNGANSDTGVEYGDAVGTSDCGEIQQSSQPVSSDPFEDLNVNPPIPNVSCSGSYPTHNVSTAAALATTHCGTVRLTSNITLTSPNQIITIYNGSLDLNGYTLQTASGGSATLIFTGQNVTGGSVTYNHYPTSSVNNAGILDITAPSSGDFVGVAVMQDKRLNDSSKNNLDMTYTGNGPTLKISGLIYFPKGDFDIRGAINHNTGGLSCLGVVADTILVSGTGAVFDNATSECGTLGLVLPTIPNSNQRQALVQ